MKRNLVILMVVALLTITVVTVATADGVVPLEPQTPQPSTYEGNGEFLDETPSSWFVEFKTPPTIDGSKPNQVKQEKANFHAAAKKAGLEYTIRYSFDTLWNGISIEIGPADVNKLASMPGVKAVYPVQKIEIPETTMGASPELYTAIQMTGADIAQSELGFTGEGIKVAVMDTGIDYDHPDLGGCFGDGCRVAYGYDLVGDDYNADPSAASYNPIPSPDPDPDDCQGHGTHVSGIVGANGTVVGVAPDVTFGAYRVFGCEGSTDSDIMIAAMEMALKDKMDILNMSIGSAYTWPQYPTAQAADRLVKHGMVVVASIGNSGANGLYSAGAPGLGKDVIGVASFYNSHVTLPYFEVNGTNIGYVPMSYAGPTPTEGTEEIVYIGLACNGLPLDNDPDGKVALAMRGDCSFYDKAFNAIEAGAVAVVVHNNAPGVFNGTLGTSIDGTTPVVGISLEDGLFIRDQLPPVEMTWTDQQDMFLSPTGGLISSFSSYGLAADLSLKPDIGAPGGNIYSTYPLEKGGYATMGGTSMASPHVAGAAALLLQAHPDLSSYEVRGVLQNSADPKLWNLAPGYGLLDHVHRQGAGMVDIDDAILATTFITPAKIATGEGEAGSYVQTLTVENNGPEDVTYDLSSVNALSSGGVITPSYWGSDASVEFKPAVLKVKAGKSAKVEVTINPATGPEFGQYGGYLVFTPRDGGQVYSVPFAGFVGDYQGIEILTPTANEFPWLAVLYEGYFYKVAGPEDWVYSMEGEDVPYLLMHFEHQVQMLQVEIFNADDNTPLHPVFSTAIYDEYLPRNSTSTSFFAFAWDGTRLHSNGYNGVGYTKNLTAPVADGEYILVVNALKANGDPKNPDHWETWTSPVVAIERP